MLQPTSIPTPTRRSGRFANHLAGKAGACLLVMAGALTAMSGITYGDMEVYEARPPRMVHAGPKWVLKAIYNHDSVEREEILDDFVARIISQAGEDENRMVAITLREMPFDYDDLPQWGLDMVAEAYGGSNPEAWYEQQCSGFLADALGKLDAHYNKLTVAHVPFEGSEADQNNTNYAQLLSRCDGFVSSRSFIVSNGTADEINMVTDAMPNTIDIANGRPVFYRTNSGWRAIIETQTAQAAPSDQPMAEFIDLSDVFDLDNPVDITLNLFGSAPADASIVFQVWSNESHSVEAAFADYEAPFVYPAENLAQVTPGSAELQAIVRNGDDVVVAIIRADMTFLTAEVTSSPMPINPPQTPSNDEPADDGDSQTSDEGDDEPIAPMPPVLDDVIEDDAPDVQAPSQPAGPLASFVNASSTYSLNSGQDINLQLHASAPSNGNVVFQVWSDAAQAIQGPFADYEAPFVYPHTYLNQVTPGTGQIQAIIRDSNDTILSIITHDVNFTNMPAAPIDDVDDSVDAPDDVVDEPMEQDEPDQSDVTEEPVDDEQPVDNEVTDDADTGNDSETPSNDEPAGDDSPSDTSNDDQTDNSSDDDTTTLPAEDDVVEPADPADDADNDGGDTTNEDNDTTNETPQDDGDVTTEEPSDPIEEPADIVDEEPTQDDAPVTTPDEPAGPLGTFNFAGSSYLIGASGDITLTLGAGAPAGGDVVFQVWSNASFSVEAPYVDENAPFVYPAAMLANVTPGQGEIQAIIRDANDQILDVISMPLTFSVNNTPDWEDDILDETPVDTIDDDVDQDPVTPDNNDTNTETPTDNGNTDDYDSGTGVGGSTSVENNWGDPTAPSPTAQISIIDHVGMAPFTVHVHGLNSPLGVGDKLTARYEWDFGDPNGEYNNLVGWNAAHIYDQPGSYTITLRIINEAGRESIVTQNVTVSQDTRSRIYVSADGNDNNPGTINAPIKTFNRAMQMISSHKTVLFRRGDTFQMAGNGDIAHNNWVLGAYGEGPRPRILYTGPTGISQVIGMNAAHTHDVVIQDISFDTVHGNSSAQDIGNAIVPAGTNITVRDCVFGHFTQAFQGERSPVGLLTQGNVTTGQLHGYYIWAQGTDHTHLGNTVNDVYYHVMRLAGTDRVMVAFNELTNTERACIWAMTGNHVYVTQNTLNHGQMSVGPNHAFTNNSERFRWAVIEQNIHNQMADPQAAIQTKTGAEHVMIRNNIILNDNASAIKLWGYDEWNRTSVDVRIVNNTAVNNGTHGRFLDAGRDTVDVLVANNLYVAPNLTTGDYQNAICYIEDTDLSGFVAIRNNYWPIPAQMNWVGDGYHYLWANWGAGQGYRNQQEWAALSGTEDEAYANIALDEDYCPGEQAIGHGLRMPGVFVDFAGNTRPEGTEWTAGAVEMAGVDPH